MSEPLILKLKNEAIKEVGNNENGMYIKYENGLLMQRGYYSEINVSFGNMCKDFYRCNLRNFDDFPIPFVGNKTDVSVFLELQNLSTNEIAFIGKYGSSDGNNAPSLTNPGKFSIVKESDRNSDIRVSYLAIGKWK